MNIVCSGNRSSRRTTGGSDVFKAVTNCGCHFSRHSLVRSCRRLYRWSSSSSSSDGTKAEVRQVACHVGFMLHCTIQRHETELHSVMQMAVEVATLCSAYYAVYCKWPWKWRHCAAVITQCTANGRGSGDTVQRLLHSVLQMAMEVATLFSACYEVYCKWP